MAYACTATTACRVISAANANSFRKKQFVQMHLGTEQRQWAAHRGPVHLIGVENEHIVAGSMLQSKMTHPATDIQTI